MSGIVTGALGAVDGGGRRARATNHGREQAREPDDSDIGTKQEDAGNAMPSLSLKHPSTMTLMAWQTGRLATCPPDLHVNRVDEITA